MKLNWFVRKGVLYWPASVAGWCVFVIVIAYAIYQFISIDSQSHSVSDTLINWVFNLLIAGVVYTLIGFLTEKRS